MFSDIGMNQYGVSKNSKVKPITYESAMAYNINTEAYTANIKALAEKSGGAASAKDIYVFNYDWRLDPVANAGDLREFIDLVTSKPDIGRSSFHRYILISSTVISTPTENTQKKIFCHAFSLIPPQPGILLSAQ